MSGFSRSRLFPGLPALLTAAIFMTLGSVASAAELGSFYGRENIQLVEARYAPLVIPETGGNYEVLFGFVTSADRIDTPGSTRLFNGVALGGGGFNWTDAELEGHERNAAGGYITLMYRGYLFSDTKSDVRVYLNWNLGLERGAFWGDPVGEIDPVVSSMNVYCGGLGGGVSIRLKDKYSLDLGIMAEARGMALDEEFRGYYPVMVTVGLSKNIGALKHDRLPDR